MLLMPNPDKPAHFLNPDRNIGTGIVTNFKFQILNDGIIFPWQSESNEVINSYGQVLESQTRVVLQIDGMKKTVVMDTLVLSLFRSIHYIHGSDEIIFLT